MVSKLASIARKRERLILGLMSGTSLDGLDLALCQIKGSGEQTQLQINHFKTITYSAQVRADIQEIFSKPTVNMAKLSAMHARIGTLFAECTLLALNEWEINPSAIDLIASHGQTIYHAPQSLTHDFHYPNSTFQIGDGDHIAVKTGIITLSDFRQKHVAAGGEGAPLVVYGDRLLFSPKTGSRILLNIGGIANFTYLPAVDASDDLLLASDTGPGNTLMNQYMQHELDEPFDKDGALAASGKVNSNVLAALLNHPFFSAALPKTTGPELFNLAYIEKTLQQTRLSAPTHADMMATLTMFTAKSIAHGIQALNVHSLIDEIYVSGGGVHNHFLMHCLKETLPSCSIHRFDALGIPADAKEAVLFAVLANETVAGTADHMNGGVAAPQVCLGKISFPQ
ncbi:anhydro-N-acetylmuramic acid kinase AnmK [Olivibacter ginsenosidimutans]|uniref:Anhydro-N-acetylmuramic acid kinase n=1 Tax=Olivibacter ginsenosidimutans TaxID=1176537 RepID=A0ABP9AN80_9SPHI